MTSTDIATPVAAHNWQREKHEHYVEPHWTSERLFAEEKFEGPIWDPCCGFGRIPDAAVKAGLGAIGTDIVDRGRFARHAIDMEGVRKVAMIFPTQRLNAAHWLRETPLARVWLMTPRPSMPPGYTIAAGEKPGGGKVDFCWLVWTKGRVGPPDLRWLRRDG
jgi:hypothetical protein